MRVRCVSLEELLHVFVDQRMIRQLISKLCELLRRRHRSVDEQVAYRGEACIRGELLDRITAVAKDPLLPVDERDRALTGAGVAVRRIERDDPSISS